jgi:putative ABC transport system permease protein
VPGEHLSAAVREAVWSLDRTIAVPAVRPLEHVVVDALGQPRFRAWVLGVFAGSALILAMIGLYGTTAYAVQLRSQEMGLRMALGATSQMAIWTVLRGGLTLASIGIACGLGAAAAVTRLLSAFLFDIGPSDPATFVSLPVLLLALTWTACYVPARRVRRIDPLAAINANP